MENRDVHCSRSSSGCGLCPMPPTPPSSSLFRPIDQTKMSSVCLLCRRLALGFFFCIDLVVGWYLFGGCVCAVLVVGVGSKSYCSYVCVWMFVLRLISAWWFQVVDARKRFGVCVCLCVCFIEMLSVAIEQSIWCKVGGIESIRFWWGGEGGLEAKEVDRTSSFGSSNFFFHISFFKRSSFPYHSVFLIRDGFLGINYLQTKYFSGWGRGRECSDRKHKYNQIGVSLYLSLPLSIHVFSV